MHTIGIGVIGWGFMGKAHTQALLNLPLYYPGIDFAPALRVVCARHIDHAEEAARSAGFEAFTDDWREVIARDDVDVVSICTPNEQHEEMAVAALRAGKHVYIDKPLAVTADSARRIADAAKEAKGSASVVFNNRFLPATLRAKELVEAGRLGDILTFTARYLHSGSIDPDKPIGWKQQEQGGVILDLGSHALDLLTWLIGYPRRALCATYTLYGARPTKDGGVERALSEDHAQAILEYPNGAVGSVEASKIATGASDELILELRGTKGALRYNSMDINYLYFYDNTLPEAPYGGARGYTQIECVGRYPAPGGRFMTPKASVGWERGHLHCYYSFLDAVAHGRTPACGLDEAARLQELMEALKESARTGKWMETL